jgi:hypothetical protein
LVGGDPGNLDLMPAKRKQEPIIANKTSMLEIRRKLAFGKNERPCLKIA